MAVPRVFAGAWSTGVRSTSRTLVEPGESVGKPTDAPATVQNSTNTAFSLVKGMLAGLGVAAGSPSAFVGLPSYVDQNAERALGDPSDAPAASADGASAISLLKGILQIAGL